MNCVTGDPDDITVSAESIGAGRAAEPWFAAYQCTHKSLRRIVRIAPEAADGITAGLATQAVSDTTMRLLAILSADQKPAAKRRRS